MANISEDANQTRVQELPCPTGLYGKHTKMIISVSNMPLCITAFLGNVLIIVALAKVSSIAGPSKLLYRCLAVTDLCVGLITQPLFSAFLMSSEHPYRCFYVVSLLNTMGLTFNLVSLLTITAISVDRLLALSLGLRYRQIVTLRRVGVIVFVIWLFSAPIGAAFIFYSLRLLTFMICMLMLISLITSTFCYTKIYLKLLHQQLQVQEHAQQGEPNTEEAPLNIARYRKTVANALCVHITLLACYIPYLMIAAIFSITGERAPSFDVAWDVTLSLLLLNSSLNPFIYCWKIKEVRQAVKETLRQFCCWCGT